MTEMGVLISIVVSTFIWHDLSPIPTPHWSCINLKQLSACFSASFTNCMKKSGAFLYTEQMNSQPTHFLWITPNNSIAWHQQDSHSHGLQWLGSHHSFLSLHKLSRYHAPDLHINGSCLAAVNGGKYSCSYWGRYNNAYISLYVILGRRGHTCCLRMYMYVWMCYV